MRRCIRSIPTRWPTTDDMIDCVERFRAFTREIDLPYDVPPQRRAQYAADDGARRGADAADGPARHRQRRSDRRRRAGAAGRFHEAGAIFTPNWPRGNLCGSRGSTARAIWVDLPDTQHTWDTVAAEICAQLDRSPNFRQAVINQMRPHVGDAVKIGFPAVLGMDQPLEVLDDLTRTDRAARVRDSDAAAECAGYASE